MDREARKLTVELCDWLALAEGSSCGYYRILSKADKDDIQRGRTRLDENSSGSGFPLHELVDHYRDPAIRKTLIGRGGVLVATDLFPGCRGSYSDLVDKFGIKFKTFSKSLALRVASLMGYSPEMTQHLERVKRLLTRKVLKIQIWHELKFSIQNNPGKLSVRTLEVFHGKRPSRAVMVRSPFGKSYQMVYDMLYDTS